MAATTASNKSFLTTAQGRMQHIQERIKVADLSPITRLALITKDNDNVELDVDPNGIAVIDNFLGTEVIRAMRSEAEGLKLGQLNVLARTECSTFHHREVHSHMSVSL